MVRNKYIATHSITATFDIPFRNMSVDVMDGSTKHYFRAPSCFVTNTCEIFMGGIFSMSLRAVITNFLTTPRGQEFTIYTN